MTHKKPPRERFPARIALRRERGAAPASIAQYAHLIIMQTGLSPDALGLFAAERVMLDELLAARAAAKAAQVAEARSQYETPEYRQWAAAEKAREDAAKARRAGMRKGGAILATRVREELGCSLTELNRWANDGRLPPDGEILLDGSVFGKKVNARAWLPITIETAKASIEAWRAQDRLVRRRA